MNRFVRYAALVAFTLVVTPSFGADKPSAPRLSIDTNLYPYLDRVDDDTDLTVAINARLPGRFSYFSFMNFRGLSGHQDSAFTRSEQNLRWSLSDNLPVDLNIQGDSNDQLQLGIGWRLSDTQFLERFFGRLNLNYRLTLHLKRFSSGDDKVWQMEHFFRMTFPYVSDRLYLSGFVDQTFDLDLPSSFPSKPILGEVQLGVRLFNHFYAVTEYRINEFRRSEPHNLAVGIEYKFRW